jgi:hypothetical protein
MLAVDAIGQIAQRIGKAAHGLDGLAPDLGNDRVIHVRDGMTEFHLDQLDCFLDPAADTPRTGAWS